MRNSATTRKLEWCHRRIVTSALASLACVLSSTFFASPQVASAALGYSATASLNRYYNGSDHWVTTGNVPANYRFEGTLGTILKQYADGMYPVYSCLVNGQDHMLSTDSRCEGTQTLGVEGYLYNSRIGSSFTGLYRCVRPGDHYASTRSDCEGGGKLEGNLGWLSSLGSRRGNLNDYQVFIPWGIRLWLNHDVAQAAWHSAQAAGNFAFLKQVSGSPLTVLGELDPIGAGLGHIGCISQFINDVHADDVGYGVAMDITVFAPFQSCDGALKVWPQ